MERIGSIMNKLKIGFILIILCYVVFVYKNLPLSACTIWAAAGTSTKNGTLIAKNHDAESYKHDELRFVVPKTGFKFLGLFPFLKEKAFELAAGINEKGLVVVSANVESVRPARTKSSIKNLSEKILSDFETVDAAISNKEIFSKSKPIFYMIADSKKISLIEITQSGAVAIITKNNGVLYHTNHYTHESLYGFNQHISKSSEARLDIIELLLDTACSPFTIDDFVEISEDHSDESDENIWRAVQSKKKISTRASWIVSLPKTGIPELYIKFISEDGKDEYTLNILLDHPFWIDGLK